MADTNPSSEGSKKRPAEATIGESPAAKRHRNEELREEEEQQEASEEEDGDELGPWQKRWQRRDQRAAKGKAEKGRSNDEVTFATDVSTVYAKTMTMTPEELRKMLAVAVCVPFQVSHLADYEFDRAMWALDIGCEVGLKTEAGVENFLGFFSEWARISKGRVQDARVEFVAAEKIVAGLKDLDTPEMRSGTTTAAKKAYTAMVKQQVKKAQINLEKAAKKLQVERRKHERAKLLRGQCLNLAESSCDAKSRLIEGVREFGNLRPRNTMLAASLLLDTHLRFNGFTDLANAAKDARENDPRVSDTIFPHPELESDDTFLDRHTLITEAKAAYKKFCQDMKIPLFPLDDSEDSGDNNHTNDERHGE